LQRTIYYLLSSLFSTFRACPDFPLISQIAIQYHDSTLSWNCIYDMDVDITEQESSSTVRAEFVASRYRHYCSTCSLVCLPYPRAAHKAAPEQRTRCSTSKGLARLCDLGHQPPQRLSARRFVQPRILAAIAVRGTSALPHAGRADERRSRDARARSERLSAERTLSVTTHCLRQQHTRLLGNGGCFVSIACTLPLTLSLSFSRLSLSVYSHTLLPLYTASPFTVFFYFWSTFQFTPGQPACIRLLGVDFRCTRHATRFASLTPYLLVPPSRSWTAGRTSPAFRTLCVSLSTIHYHTRNT